MYLESLSTVLYASRFHPIGINITSFFINASAELTDCEKTFSNGKRQIKINKKQTKAITQSPIFVVRDSIMIDTPFLFYQIPRSPNFLAIELAIAKKITQITDWKRPTAVVKENCKPLTP